MLAREHPGKLNPLWRICYSFWLLAGWLTKFSNRFVEMTLIDAKYMHIDLVCRKILLYCEFSRLK